MRYSILIVALALLALATEVDTASAQNCHFGRTPVPWHQGYYNSAWGGPVALVVPPTAEAQTQWGWGVGNTRIVAICPQFRRGWPGPSQYDRSLFRPTPRWPSDTNQSGYYYVRGPW